MLISNENILRIISYLIQLKEVHRNKISPYCKSFRSLFWVLFVVFVVLLERIKPSLDVSSLSPAELGRLLLLARSPLFASEPNPLPNDGVRDLFLRRLLLLFFKFLLLAVVFEAEEVPFLLSLFISEILSSSVELASVTTFCFR